jgi:tetratricopeptide (TPR) repeat protein
VSSDPTPAPYTLRGIQQMLGMSRGVVLRLVAAGFVTPSRGPRNAYRFTFQDVVLLRTAYSLQRAQIAPRTIARALERLAAGLPDDLPLSGLRLTAVGRAIAVRDKDAHWDANSGQRLIDFEPVPTRRDAAVLQHPAAPPADHDDTRGLVAAAELLEATAPDLAEAMYRRALAAAPEAVDAHLNLGAMLCEMGRHEEAVQLYGEAIVRYGDDAALHFNLAIALEDLGRLDDALSSYETCLRLQPRMADAHFNAARLHERRGDLQGALRHFSAYRRLRR